MPTDNHNLNQPNKGATDWEVPINENWDVIDQQLIARDLDGNIGAYTPYQDAIFVATDTYDVYFGDGDNWSQQGQWFSGTGGGPILDLDDDGSNESSALDEIATTGDTTGVFTEPSPDKLLVDASVLWPGGSSVTIEDSGANQGTANTLNLGTDLTATVSGGTAAISSTASSGSGAAPDYIVESGDTIQTAINNLTNDNTARWIHIAPGYDESFESRPITVDSTPLITGAGVGDEADIVFPTDSTDVFQMDTTSTPQEYPIFRDLKIQGGRNAFNVIDCENFNLTNVVMENQNNAGVTYTGSFSGWSVLDHCVVDNPGSSLGDAGIEMRDATTGPNATIIRECQVKNGAGAGIAPDGFMIEVYRGSIERNDEPGLLIDPANSGSFIADGVYFESNAEGETDGTVRDTDILVDNRSGGNQDTVIRNTRQAGGGTPAGHHIVVDGSTSTSWNVEVVSPFGQDVSAFGSPALGRVRFESNTRDCKALLDDRKVEVIDNGSTRLTIGYGEHGDNGGTDPNSGGDWSGFHRTGVSVEGDASTVYHAMPGGAWLS